VLFVLPQLISRFPLCLGGGDNSVALALELAYAARGSAATDIEVCVASRFVCLLGLSTGVFCYM
jgi:hypothetical protein